MEVIDFGGYATKAGLKCSDGLTITAEAFKHMDGMKVPLVWQHGHSKPENVLGHAILEARDDGMYTRAVFNDTPSGRNAKILVQSGDITNLSIYANQLVQKSKMVLHGMIREVSLVLSGANPGAKIDFVNIVHSDGEIEVVEDEAVIYNDQVIDTEPEKKEESGEEKVVEHADTDTPQEIYEAMSEEQKGILHYMVAAALEGKVSEAEHSETKVDENPVEDNLEEKTEEGDALTHQEGTTIVTKNVFDKSGEGDKGGKHVLSHSDIKGIFESAKSSGSMRSALNDYVLQHGIDNMEVLFPDAKALTNRPEFDKRRTEWVSKVLSSVGRTPFAKVKTLSADLNFDEARAKGYVKGTMKKEEFFPVATRSTGPTTIYKKQKLDRDDIIDISDFDVVAWLWTEIRIMLEEELARAILISDGRAVDDEDKIKDPAAAASGDGIRSILNDHDYYAQTIFMNLDEDGATYLDFVDQVIAARRYYKGTGTPTFFTTEVVLAKMLTLRDPDGRRYFRTVDELASELRVDAIVPVEVMEGEADLLGIMVNLRDYNLGTNRGGEITTFDDFDIDYNQYKYLMETRLSGALTKVKSALIFKKVDSEDVLVAAPNAPTFVSSTGVVTIVATTGVVYKNKATGATLSTGAQSAIPAGTSITVVATPASGYYLADNINDEWKFTRDAA